jgi:hypothetical protein
MRAVFRNFEAGQLDRLLPDDRQFGPVHVFHAADDDVVLAGAKSEELGHRGSALDDNERALFHALGQLRNGRSARAQDNDVGGGRGLRLESHG